MENKVLEFRPLLIESKFEYEVFFDLSGKYDYINSAIKIIERYVGQYNKLNFAKYACLITAGFIFSLYICTVVDNSIEYRYDFLLIICLPLIIVAFVLIHIIGKHNDSFIDFQEEVSSVVGDFAKVKLSDNSTLKNILLTLSKDLSLKIDKQRSVLSESLSKLDPYITDDYQTYKHIRTLLTIINNGRIDTMKELINTMVNDYQMEEISNSIYEMVSTVENGLTELCIELGKNTKAIEETKDMIAASAIVQIGTNSSDMQKRANRQCLSCAKFSKCRNPYVYGCGAYVPR